MPVRIYDIAKRLGIESKEVLAKAKALGITNVKVASSSLDKITGEYLEQQLAADRPPPPAPEPVVVVAAPLPEVPLPGGEAVRAEVPAPAAVTIEISPRAGVECDP